MDNKDDLMSKLSRIVQLTGFSDQVYAEAVVNVHQYDVLLGKDIYIYIAKRSKFINIYIDFLIIIIIYRCVDCKSNS